MPLPEKDSPFWPLARSIVVAALLFGMLALNYNKFDARDLGTIFTVLAGLGLFDGFKTIVAKPPDKDV